MSKMRWMSIGVSVAVVMNACANDGEEVDAREPVSRGLPAISLDSECTGCHDDEPFEHLAARARDLYDSTGLMHPQVRPEWHFPTNYLESPDEGLFKLPESGDKHDAPGYCSNGGASCNHHRCCNDGACIIDAYNGPAIECCTCTDTMGWCQKSKQWCNIYRGGRNFEQCPNGHYCTSCGAPSGHDEGPDGECLTEDDVLSGGLYPL